MNFGREKNVKKKIEKYEYMYVNKCKVIVHNTS
jgi:hypothetical protein